MANNRRISRPFRRSPRNELQIRIDNYRRHKDFNPAIVERVIKQARERGMAYVISTVSDEARALYLGSRDVAGECHRAQGFLRFNVHGNLLVARAEFEHNVVDLILKHFMVRFPKKKVVIICGGLAFVGDGDHIKRENPKSYTTFLNEAQHEEDVEWNAFYNSQYIDARRNRRLAMRSVPKKLWKRFGIKEGVKIDKGIPSVTLEDFM
jgi:probable DNA metabolism protein